jgi:hypothetical protein
MQYILYKRLKIYIFKNTYAFRVVADHAQGAKIALKMVSRVKLDVT